ncbi:MAG TPA: ATP-binding cassette domain-containing protein [Acidimicrobiales bacterium]|nr:ATP-binding cassette domain-containing protein [Acidimicrobiales bacterium]
MKVAVAERDIHVEFDAPDGQVTVLLGPNGAGKSTVLRAVAASSPSRVGLMFQDHLLFPHMSVLDNVAFGPRSRDVGRAWLERIGLSALAAAKPRTLSGGQAQLVALARTLAASPDSLLLDEPLAALDAATRVAVRRELRRFLAEFAGATVLVTHDPVDAYLLADRVVVIEHGRITQEGTLADITARPASRYVAELVGTNLVRGTATGVSITTVEGAQLTLAEPVDGDVLATIAPEAITLHAAQPHSSARNRWRTTVEHVETIGARVRVQLGDPLPLVAEITPAAATDLDITEGSAVWASVKATEIVTYPS